MTKTEQKVIKFINDKKLVSPGDKILTALSGGPDSVFLLNFLLKYKRKYKIEIAAFHLNHMLRGKAADKDEEFCSRFCIERKIPFISQKSDVKTIAQNLKISVEEAGRNIRYSMLNLTAEQYGFTKIATGHNLDDNTETVLLNLIKGTGIRGISGIPYKRGIIIRPLLSLSKDEIKTFLTGNGIPYLTDKTNLKNDYERNFIRNKIIPLIRKRLNPSVDEAVLRSSEIFREVASYIDRKADEAVEKFGQNEEIVKIDIEQLKLNDTALQPEIVKKIIERNFITTLSFNDTKSVLSLIDKKTGTKVSLPGKIQVVRERTYLVIYEKELSGRTEQSVKIGGQCQINGKVLTISEWKKKPEFNDDKNIEFINGDLLGDKFTVRQWKPGDKFSPIGMKGTVKISDFLNSLKIPSSGKNKKLILTDNKDIIWVIGYRINEKFKIKKETRRVLKLWLK